MDSLLSKLRLRVWGVSRLLRLGRPEISLGFLGSIGDDLLCTAPIEEWRKRGVGRIWFFTRHPDLYSFPGQAVGLVPDDPRYQRLAARLGRPLRALGYSSFDAATDRDSALREHIIADMCRRAQLHGRIALRPHLPLSAAERNAAKDWAGWVAIQTSSLSAALPMKNKQWRAERFQAVVSHLVAAQLRLVQIGSPSDSPVSGAEDLRGKTSLRQTAAILGQARIFIGLAGFLMHLARAVDCPAVIVYGGREPPELTGYSCNINVASRPACAPCWQRNRCDYEHTCMESIDADRVIAAIEQLLARPRDPLDVDFAEL